MTTLSLQTPVVGQPNSTEDPKIASDLTAISTWANGNIDTINLSNSAGIGRYLSGTLAARPAAGAVVAGTQYYASDKAIYYESNGSAWGTMLIASSWSALALGSGITAQTGTYTPAFRQVGDIIQLRGGMATAGGVASGVPWATVPAPASYVSFIAPMGLGAGGLATPTGVTANFVPLQIPALGTSIFAYAPVAAGNYIPLDGLSYTTS